MNVKMTIYFDHYQTTITRKLFEPDTTPNIQEIKKQTNKELTKQIGEALSHSKDGQHFIFSFHRGAFTNCIGVTWEFIEYPFEIT